MTQENENNENGEKVIVHVDPDLEDLIPGYLQNRKGDIQAIREALDAEDFVMIRRLSHSMKGSGGGYGFQDIAELARSMEEAAKERNEDEIRQLTGSLSNDLERVEVIFDREQS